MKIGWEMPPHPGGLGAHIERTIGPHCHLRMIRAHPGGLCSDIERTIIGPHCHLEDHV